MMPVTRRSPRDEAEVEVLGLEEFLGFCGLNRDLTGASAASEYALWTKHSVHRVPAAVKRTTTRTPTGRRWCRWAPSTTATRGCWPWSGGGYAHNDPVFGRHGALYMVPYVRRDMLIVENQLPLLLLLQKLVAVETGKDSQDMVMDTYATLSSSISMDSPSFLLTMGVYLKKVDIEYKVKK
uniref:Uncharacterized protein n=1 Tax=Oryza punctata TaxID=4537 RepID=A0A0E0MME2_ORYPU